METTTQLEHERAFAKAVASSLPDDEYRRFFGGSFTAKTGVTTGSKLVIFKVIDGQPELLETLTATHCEFNFDEGAAIEFTSDVLMSEPFMVGHEPVEIAPGVFLWMPKFSLVERFLANGLYQSRIGLALRLPHNPRLNLREGECYAVEPYKLEMIRKKTSAVEV